MMNRMMITPEHDAAIKNDGQFDQNNSGNDLVKYHSELGSVAGVSANCEIGLTFKKRKKSTKNVNEKEKFVCSYCQKVTRSRVSYLTHVYRVHGIVVDGVETFTCSICGKVFMSKHYMNTHKLTFHNNRRPVSCPFCGKIKIGTHLLEDHIKTVHEAPRFICDICGQTCVSNSRLRGHIQEKHERKRPFTCDVEGCTSAFYRQRSLSIHMRNVHERAKDFKCNWLACNRAFHSVYSLKRHELIHSGDKPIQCRHCDYSCRQNTSLKLHLRKIHPQSSEVTQEDIISKLVEVPKVSSLHTDEIKEMPVNSSYHGDILKSEKSHNYSIIANALTANNSDTEIDDFDNVDDDDDDDVDDDDDDYKPISIAPIDVVSNSIRENDDDITLSCDEETSYAKIIENQVVVSLQHAFEPDSLCSPAYINSYPSRETEYQPTKLHHENDQQTGIVILQHGPLHMFRKSKQFDLPNFEVSPTGSNSSRFPTNQSVLNGNIADDHQGCHPQGEGMANMDVDDIKPDLPSNNNNTVALLDFGMKSDCGSTASTGLREIKLEDLNHLSKTDISLTTTTDSRSIMDNDVACDQLCDAGKRTTLCEDQRIKSTFLCQSCGEALCDGEAYIKHLSDKHGLSSLTRNPTIQKSPKKPRRDYVDPIVLSEPAELTRLIYSCPNCGIGLKSRYALQKHLLDAHTELNPVLDPQQCSVCDKVFFIKSELEQHCKTVHSERKPCPICGKLFKPTYLAEHEKNVHRDGGSRFRCEICNQGCISRSRLKYHIMETHKNTKRFSCPVAGCDTSFLRMATYRSHMDQVHSKVKNYKCPWNACDKAFGRQSHLKRHMLLHTGEKPLKCSLCDYQCRQNGSLKIHMQTTHRFDMASSSSSSL